MRGEQDLKPRKRGSTGTKIMEKIYAKYLKTVK